MKTIKQLVHTTLLAVMAFGAVQPSSAAAQTHEFTGKISAYDYDIGYRKFYMDGVKYFCGDRTQQYGYINPNDTHKKFDNILRAAFHANKTVTIKTEYINNQCSIKSVQVYQHAQYAKLKQ